MGEFLNPRIKAFVLRNKIALAIAAILLVAIAYSTISSQREFDEFSRDTQHSICLSQQANGVPVDYR